MPSNFTPNYNLNQWEADDRVLRTDFNADNAKLEAALSSLEERVARLGRAVPNLAYYTGLLALTDYAKRGKVLAGQSMVYDDFQYSQGTCTGGLKFVNGVLTLEGVGATGVFTSGNIGVDNSGWTQARLWVHHSQASAIIKPSLNGAPMEYQYFRSTIVPKDTRECYESTFAVDRAGPASVTISLELGTGSKSSVEVYDYLLFLF